MRVLAIVHGYPPKQNAGAEWMLHEMLKFLAGKGHTCEVAIKDSDFEFEGIKVSSLTRDMIDRADLIISHLKRAGLALNTCEYYRKPFVFIAHNSNYYHPVVVKNRDIGAGRFVYVVHNSENIQKEMHYPNPSITVRPHVDLKRYKTKRGERITLINLFERKGGKLFHELAEDMPDYKFLGVEGGYGKQESSFLKNISYMKNTPDAKKIYSQTRILLMPSQYESYGRTGIEAMCSGIPVLAYPTPGLLESLSDAGIFCKTKAEFIEEIKRLDDEKYYKEVSVKCVERAKEVEKQTAKDLKTMESFFQNIIEHKV